MELDNEELEATKDIKFYKDGEMTVEYAIQRLTNLAQERTENWLGLTIIEARQVVLKELEGVTTFKHHCKRHINFCNRIRKEEKREPDEFNQGREDMAKQFLNLLNGKEDWEITE